MCYIKLFVCSLLLVTISAAPIEQNNLAFQRYAQTLNNPKLIPFLSECLPKPINRKDEIFCNAYFDMLLHLNEDPTAQNIVEIQSSSGRDEIVKNFCSHFIENVPKTSNVTMFTSDVEQFYKIIVTDENCKTFCLELDSDLKKTVKQKCVLLSWGYDSIARTSVIADATKDKTVSSNLEDTADHQLDPNSVVASVIAPNPIKFVEQTKINTGIQTKDEEQPKTFVPVNEIPLKENSPSKSVTPESQNVLSSEDKKPIDTIPSSSEKMKNSKKIVPFEPPTEDLDSSKNPINDPKLSEQSAIEPSETDLIDEKDAKVEDPATESSALNSALNLDENGNDNNAFDMPENNGKFCLFLMKLVHGSFPACRQKCKLPNTERIIGPLSIERLTM